MIQKNFVGAALNPLFTTDIKDLFQVFLDNLDPEHRQHYTCNSCRRFVNRFGGLVSIDIEDNTTKSFLTEVGVSAFFVPATRAMVKKIEAARVTGVFLTTSTILGEPKTGEWEHMAVKLKTPIYVAGLKDAGQAMAEKLEDYKMLVSALLEFPLETVKQARRVLESDALYRSEKVLGVAKWLEDCHTYRAKLKNSRLKENVTWLYVAAAPAGFCHIKSSMIGTLLEDIAAGLPFEDVSKKFADKMHPLKYQRPTVAPSAGNVRQAEKIVEKLGIENSLKRRFARLEDLDTFWTPGVYKRANSDKSLGGMFGNVKVKNPNPKYVREDLVLPAQTMTIEKFRKVVLPKALKIELMIPFHGGFGALVTAEDPDAPPILQWDTLEQRNPMSWYFYSNGSDALSWGLSANEFVEVTALTKSPPHWYGRPSPNNAEGVFFVLRGAKDKRDSGLGLFPEILKIELREVRATIESYSNTGKISGRENASAAGLVFGMSDKTKFHLRVTTEDGVQEIKLDRWD
jgi:hypothetical protein